MTIRRALRATVLSAILACVLPMPSAYACSCVSEPGRADAPLEGTVFYGEVVRRVVRGGTAVYVVDVERVYAGEVAERAEVRTAEHGATCGLEIPGRGHAVFYAREEDGHLTASLCSGTRSVDGPPANLGEGEAPSGSVGAGTAAPPSGSGGGGDDDGGQGALPYVAAALTLVGAVLVLRATRPTPRSVSPTV